MSPRGRVLILLLSPDIFRLAVNVDVCCAAPLNSESLFEYEAASIAHKGPVANVVFSVKNILIVEAHDVVKAHKFEIDVVNCCIMDIDVHENLGVQEGYRGNHPVEGHPMEEGGFFGSGEGHNTVPGFEEEVDGGLCIRVIWMSDTIACPRNNRITLVGSAHRDDGAKDSF